MTYWSISCEGYQPPQEEPKDPPILWIDQTGTLTVRKNPALPDQFAIDFPDIACADIHISDHRIHIHPTAPHQSPETLQHLLVDQVLPRVIAHEGNLVLHAAALQRDGGTIVLLGDTGRGKSTLSASLQARGWTLLGDDALIISGKDNAFFGEATYKSLRLLPDSIAALYPSAPDLEPVAHYTEKQRVVQPVNPRQGKMPIQAFFILAAKPQDDNVSVKRISAAKTCIELITNSFALDPTDIDLAKQKLSIASDMATHIPGFALSYPRDYARLAEVHEAIQTALGS